MTSRRIQGLAGCARPAAGWTGIAILGFAALASAQAPLNYDQVDIAVTAEQQVDNDVLIAVVFAQAEAQRQAVAANDVNEAVGWALEQARRERAVTARTQQYNSFPVYGNNRRITGWRARQSIRLESEDTDALSELLGALQSRLAIESVQYAVSPGARHAANDSLIEEALERFEQRAELIAGALGRRGYRVVRMSVNTNEGFNYPVPMQARGMAEMALDVAAPVFEAGTQTLTATVSGTIELEAAR